VSAFVIWAVVALSATFWATRLLVRSPSAPPHAAPAGESVVARGDLSRLFGATTTASIPAAAAPAVSSRFRLVGVAAPKAGSQTRGGVALIAVDGKPPRPFRVGAAVDGDLTLRAVDLRTASLGPRDGRDTVILEIPPRPVAATGNLPPAPSFGAAAPSTTVPSTSSAVTPQGSVGPQGAPAAQPGGAPARLRPTVVPGSESLAAPPTAPAGASAVR
jgi:general secretion pathway protein C